MRDLFDGIKSNSIVSLTLNNSHFEVQLPPFLDTLLLPGTQYDDDFLDHNEGASWGIGVNYGWHLPSLCPWKALLLLDTDNDDYLESIRNRSKAGIAQDDIDLAENLEKFMTEANIHVRRVPFPL